MRGIYILIFLSIILISCGTTRLESPQTCDAKLEKALSLPTDAERVTELKVRVKHCPSHVPTLLATAKLYTEMTKEADENWLKLSVQYYRTAIDSAPNNVEAHWGLASVLEYVGEYGKASEQYQWVVTNSSDQKQIKEARVHSITCNYLLKYVKPKKQQNIRADSIDVSSEAIKDKSGWDYLKELTASVAVAGGITALKGNGQHVQYALGLLYDWIDAPQGQSVQARNRFLSGMVSTLASIISGQNLNAKLAGSFNSSASGMPDAGYAGEMENDFKSGQPDEGRTFNVSDDLTVTEKWDVPDISGLWNFFSSDGRTILCSVRPIMPNNSTLVKIEQTGKTIKMIILSKPQDEYRGEIQGKSLEIKYEFHSGRYSEIKTINLTYDTKYHMSGTLTDDYGDCTIQWTVNADKSH